MRNVGYEIDIVCIMSENKKMKTIRWSQEKNRQLQQERGLTFEMVLVAINRGGILDDLVHPNLIKYPNQRIMILKIGDYAYLVPYVDLSFYLLGSKVNNRFYLFFYFV